MTCFLTLLVGIWCCFRECLIDFYTSSGKRKPDQVIIFRSVNVLTGCKSGLLRTLFLCLEITVWFRKLVSYLQFPLLLWQRPDLLLILGMALAKVSLTRCWTLSWIKSLRCFFVSNCIGVIVMFLFIYVSSIARLPLYTWVLLPLQACKFLDEKWNPKFTLIIAQKNHHTKFFIPGKPDNVPAGNP